ncbi:hypothetical protein KR074_001782, partial [Drosophila pseudoananassae]
SCVFKMFFIFVLSIAFAQIPQSHTRSVLVLNPASVDKYLDHGDVLLEYYSSPCRSCARAPSSLDILVDSLNSSSPLTLAAINCAEHSQYCLKKKIRQYPHLSYIQQSSGQMENTKHIKELFDIMAQYNISIKTFDEGSHAFSNPYSRFPSDFCVPGHVYYLKPNRFYTSISNGTYFIKFFSPKCLSCNKLLPVWRDLAANMVNETSLCIAEFDCTSGMRICKELNTTRVPSLLWFKDGKLVKRYVGPRHGTQMELFVDGMIKGKNKILKSSRSQKIVGGIKLILYMFIINILL